MSSLREQLTGIYREHGTLTPKLVVDVARDPEHPLHSRFEWDDSVAGERYREIQARELIRVVKVTEAAGDNDVRRVRSFLSVQRPDGPSYVPAEEVKADPLMARMVLQAAEREWRQLYAKYRHLGEFLDLVRKDIAS